MRIHVGVFNTRLKKGVGQICPDKVRESSQEQGGQGGQGGEGGRFAGMTRPTLSLVHLLILITIGPRCASTFSQEENHWIFQSFSIFLSIFLYPFSLSILSCPGSSIPTYVVVGDCHFRISTQRVTFETSDPSDIWSDGWAEKKKFWKTSELFSTFFPTFFLIFSNFWLKYFLTFF